MCVCVCVRACVCARVCVRACVRAFVCRYVTVCERGGGHQRDAEGLGRRRQDPGPGQDAARVEDVHLRESVLKSLSLSPC